VKKSKKTRTQLDREIAASLARGDKRKALPPKHLLTTNRLIVVESDGDQDTMTWGDFADANREMPELADVADELRKYGRATIGGGAAPFTVVRIAD
jgi:hypothetical protein